MRSASADETSLSENAVAINPDLLPVPHTSTNFFTYLSGRYYLPEEYLTGKLPPSYDQQELHIELKTIDIRTGQLCDSLTTRIPNATATIKTRSKAAIRIFDIAPMQREGEAVIDVIDELSSRYKLVVSYGSSNHRTLVAQIWDLHDSTVLTTCEMLRPDPRKSSLFSSGGSDSHKSGCDGSSSNGSGPIKSGSDLAHSSTVELDYSLHREKTKSWQISEILSLDPEQHFGKGNCRILTISPLSPHDRQLFYVTIELSTSEYHKHVSWTLQLKRSGGPANFNLTVLETNTYDSALICIPSTITLNPRTRIGFTTHAWKVHEVDRRRYKRPEVSDRTVSILSYDEDTTMYPYYCWEPYLGRIRDWTVIDGPEGDPGAPRTVTKTYPYCYSRRDLKDYEKTEREFRGYWKCDAKVDGSLPDVLEVRDDCIILEGTVFLF
ncbi:hypothetical protein BJ508DRAFT_24353 [Ascobolus immersus RN42]|uniref:Uncharacterized protein n=1 Tax=Ascobolus immersus RN42 TaxID=1160509 RepID=A0A3N4HTK4_ASCIM|nr:hypothetical protein BJ508DRAFT_24353 [Ascobolus immersus RN42]